MRRLRRADRFLMARHGSAEIGMGFSIAKGGVCAAYGDGPLSHGTARHGSAESGIGILNRRGGICAAFGGGPIPIRRKKSRKTGDG
jgi:hypothetical protein